MMNDTPYHSKHFHIEQLADGVFAAINTEEGWAISNSGIIDLGGKTLVYDSFTAPQAATDLRDAAEQLTGRPVNMLVNSHYHNDHIWGNQAFDSDVNIISTEKTRQLIITEGAAEIKWYRETTQPRLAALEAQYAMANEEVRHQLKPLIFNYQAIAAALPILQVRLPNITFTGETVFYGARRPARLIPFDNGHCGSDAILYLPDDGIVFMEDTLFIHCHPYLADGDPKVIQHILAQVKQLHPSIVVPGHGPVGKLEDLDVLDGYIRTLQTLASDAIDQGLFKDQLEQMLIPKQYQNFLYPMFFSTNLNFMVQLQVEKDHLE